MFPLFYQEKSASTNDEILHFINPEWAACALYTFNQVEGRGQYGNRWEALPGNNLAFSFALKLRVSPLSGHLFNYHTALTVRDFIANLTKREVFIKWPNDLILNGKKICGMLIEKRKISNEDYFIIGIGVNVLQVDFQRLPKAGSLLTQTGIRFDLKETAEGLHQHLSEKLMAEAGQGVLQKFNEKLFRKDAISVFEIDGVRQNGIIQSADENGCLWVELEHGGLQKFYHKQVELLY